MEKELEIESIATQDKVTIFRKVSFGLTGLILGGLCFGFIWLTCVGGCYGPSKTKLVIGSISSLVFLFSMISLGFKNSKSLAFIAAISIIVYFANFL